jgi:membrane-bound lytic murein transglycosylase B
MKLLELKLPVLKLPELKLSHLSGLLLVAFVSACNTGRITAAESVPSTASATQPTTTPAAAATTVATANSTTDNTTALVPSADFTAWLAELRREASSKGISNTTLDTAFANVLAPIPRVLELDRSQPEFVQTFAGYMRNRISDRRIAKGRELLQHHQALFADIEKRYGVQPQYLVSFWGLESNFGAETGGFSVINALATLAYDPRRAAMFRAEILIALDIIQSGHISASAMTGSWAGAMGQTQFLPSTFKAYAVDGDGDGKIDIWKSVPDVMYSAANYLSKAGWKGDERWGREVQLPTNFDFALSGTGVRKTVSEWHALGVRRVDGAPLGQGDILASLVVPAGANGPAFLGYNNFRTTMVWNRSTNYAISVGHLADRFMGEGPIAHMSSNDEKALARADVEELQTLLNQLGVDAGKPDGVLGTRTREAVREYQVRHQLTADGYASYAMLDVLRKAAQKN